MEKFLQHKTRDLTIRLICIPQNLKYLILTKLKFYYFNEIIKKLDHISILLNYKDYTDCFKFMSHVIINNSIRTHNMPSITVVTLNKNQYIFVFCVFIKQKKILFLVKQLIIVELQLNVMR